MVGIRDKFLKWLDKNYPDEHGAASALARAIGKDQSRISRWRMARREGKDVLPPIDIEGLARLAKAHNLDRAWKLVREIELETVDRSGGSMHSLAEKYREDWDELFRHDRLKSARILMNLTQQERLGYTALISQVVRLIIDLGPERAAGQVAGLLASFEEKQTSHKTKLRRQFAAEYEEIEA